MSASIIFQNARVPALIAGLALGVMAIPVVVAGFGSGGLAGGATLGVPGIPPPPPGPRSDGTVPGIGIHLGREPSLAAGLDPAVGAMPPPAVAASGRPAFALMEGLAETGDDDRGNGNFPPGLARAGAPIPTNRAIPGMADVRRAHSGGGVEPPRRERDIRSDRGFSSSTGGTVKPEEGPAENDQVAEEAQAMNSYDYESYDDDEAAAASQQDLGDGSGGPSARHRRCATRRCQRMVRHHRP